MPPSPESAAWQDWPLLYETLRRFEDRQILPSDVFEELADEIKGTSGRLATVWNTRFTGEVYEELFRAIREGKTVRDFTTEAQKILDKYGASEGLQIYSGDRWSASYADTVFRTNMQQAYAAGRYAEMFHPDWMEAEPYWRYSAIEDARTRPEHAALDGKVFRKDDPIARRYLPPWAFGCRCQAIPLTQEDLDDLGVQPAGGADIKNIPMTDGNGDPLLDKAGAPLTVGLPPKGWDADRVESLVPGVLRTSPSPVRPAAPVPVTPAPPPPVQSPPRTAPSPAPPPAPAVPAPAAKPRPLPPLTPQGPAVSAALNTRRVPMKHRLEADRVLKAIDSVHGDGQMQQSPVSFVAGPTGSYQYGVFSQSPGLIRVGKGTHLRLQQLAHEIGHKLDREGMPGAGMTSGSSQGALADVLQAIRRSRSVSELQALPRTRYVNYLLSDVELWARAYAQFIAEESGDTALLGEIAQIRTGTGGGRLPQAQWDPVDFAPIRTKIREMMRRLGWVT